MRFFLFFAFVVVGRAASVTFWNTDTVPVGLQLATKTTASSVEHIFMPCPAQGTVVLPLPPVDPWGGVQLYVFSPNGNYPVNVTNYVEKGFLTVQAGSWGSQWGWCEDVNATSGGSSAAFPLVVLFCFGLWFARFILTPLSHA